MESACKNCDYEAVLNFCPNCGQKKVKRIDRGYLKDEIQYTVLHMNKGFFYTLKQLLTTPGKMASDFLEGHRVNHYKPLLLVFVLSGISVFLTTSILHPVEVMEKHNEVLGLSSEYSNETYAFSMKYYSFITLLSVPIMSIFTWLVFRKWGYNYYENIVINAYYSALTLIFNIIVIIPLQLLLINNPLLFIFVPFLFYSLGMVGIFFWMYGGIYRQHSIGDFIIRSLLLFFVSITTFIIVALGIGMSIQLLQLNK